MHLISGKVYQKEVFAVIFRNIFQGQFTPKGKVFADKQPHQVRHRFSPVFWESVKSGPPKDVS